MRKHAATAAITAALACFFARWFGVGFGGRSLVGFTGIELALGTRFSPESPAAFLGSVQPQFSALFALICGAVALLANLLARKPSSVVATSAAAGSIAGMIVERILFPNILMIRSISAVEVAAQTGYYLALVLFAVGAVCAAPRELVGGHDSPNN